jgi:glutaconate CoA-transferase, subunit A
MAHTLSLKDAVAELVRDGDSVALEGFSHLVPFTAAHEIIRQQRRDLTLIRLSTDLVYDQMIGMGCAAKLVFSYSGNPGVGLLHRFRDAIENGWPHPVQIEEHSHAGLAAAFAAGASGLPFAILYGYSGTDLVKHTPTVSPLICPFTGETVMAVRAIRPDVAIIHAQQADRRGNVRFWGVRGVQKEAVLAAKRVLVTVEEVRDELEVVPNAVDLPSWTITALVHAPRGARPSYAQGYYTRDNAFYREWDAIARERNRFLQWMDENVLHHQVLQTQAV